MGLISSIVRKAKSQSIGLGLLVATAVSTSAFGAGDCGPDTQRICAAGSPWYELGHAEIRSRMGDFDFDAAVTLMPEYDMRVRYRTSGQGEAKAGELLLIGGRVLAIKGGHIEPGYEIDYLDGPVLLLQTAVSLLHVAVPEGPRGVEAEREISVREANRRIAVATASASAEYGPPWTAIGALRRKSPESVAFNLAFTYVPRDPFGRDTGQKSQSMRLSGTLDYPATRAPLPDDLSLADWKVLGIGPQTRKEGQATILDYGGNALPEVYRTVGQVRAAIKRENDPGTPDPKVDLTGYWKENCTQDFGLRIEHIGAAGMYSISFCGPGGCFEPGTYRPNSYINQDKSYQVVSPDELKVRGADGWSTYRKCTTELPALRK